MASILNQATVDGAAAAAVAQAAAEVMLHPATGIAFKSARLLVCKAGAQCHPYSVICYRCVQAEEKSAAIVKAAEAKAVSMPRPDITKLKPYDPKQPGTGSNMSVWLPAVDPAKLVPPPPSAVQIFMQRINANYPPTFYKGIPIDTTHMLEKYILPMSTTYVWCASILCLFS